MFEFWEQSKAQPLRWDQLEPRYQAMWRNICRTVLDMGVSVILTDAIQFVDSTNGDLGGAFAKALRRYIQERLEG